MHEEVFNAEPLFWFVIAGVLPLDDRFAERSKPDIAGRPQLIKGTRQILLGGMGRLTESTIVNTKNKSHAITAEVIVPASGAQGVIVAMGGGGLAKGGTVTLYVDGKKVGEGRVEQTERMIFSADETCDVGFQAGSPSSTDYGPRGNKFSGEVNWVEIDIGKDAENLDHLINLSRDESQYRSRFARRSVIRNHGRRREVPTQNRPAQQTSFARGLARILRSARV